MRLSNDAAISGSPNIYMPPDDASLYVRASIFALTRQSFGDKTNNTHYCMKLCVPGGRKESGCHKRYKSSPYNLLSAFSPNAPWYIHCGISCSHTSACPAFLSICRSRRMVILFCSGSTSSFLSYNAINTCHVANGLDALAGEVIAPAQLPETHSLLSQIDNFGVSSPDQLFLFRSQQSTSGFHYFLFGW